MWQYFRVAVYSSVLCSSLQLHDCSDNAVHSKVEQEGKAILIEAWTDLEGCRRLRLPDFETIAARS